MKKIISFVLLSLFIISFVVGCNSENTLSAPNTEYTSVNIRLGGLKGPTSMGMVKLLDDAENDKTENTYDFIMAGSADELTPKFLKGEIDIVALPVNLGSVLYNKSNGDVKILAVNTLGVNYIVEKGGENIKQLSDLKGKTLYASGKGSVPEYALNYLIKQSGLNTEDVNIVWKSEPAEIVTAMALEDNSFAMLPQPYVTVAMTKLENLRVAIDLTGEWDKISKDGKLITAGLFVRKEFADKNEKAIEKFLEEYKKSTEFVNKNINEASDLVEKYDIVKADIAKKAIPECNVVCIKGEEMKKDVSGYFEVLLNENPQSLGGKLPNNDFYYIK